MFRHKVTASKLELVQVCGWWAREDVSWDKQEAGQAAVFGSACHLAFEHVNDKSSPIDKVMSVYPNVDRDLLVAHVDAHRTWWLKNQHNQKRFFKEQAFAFDPKTKSVRPVSPPDPVHHIYKDTLPHEIPGTIDLYYVGDDYVYVGDYKTGEYKTIHDCLPQLEFAAYAVATFYKKRKAIAEVIHIGTHQNGTDIAVSPTKVNIGPDRIAKIGNIMKGTIESVPDSEPNPGSWCKWCPAKPVCPSTYDDVSGIIPLDSLTKKAKSFGELSVDTNEDAVRMLHGLWKLDAWSESKWAELQRFAEKSGGIDLGDGKRYVKTLTKRRYINGRKAVGYLEDHLGEAYMNAVDFTLTQASMRRHLIGEGKSEAEADSIVQKLMRDLEDKGAVSVKETEGFAVRKVG